MRQKTESLHDDNDDFLGIIKKKKGGGAGGNLEVNTLLFEL